MLRSVCEASAQVYLMMKDTWKQPPSLSLIIKMFWCMWQKMGKNVFIKYFTEDSLFFISIEFFQKLVSEVGDGSDTAEGEQSQVNNLYPLLMQHNGGSDSWNKGKKLQLS